MFGTVHDAILLALAALYVLITLVRAVTLPPNGSFYAPRGWFAVPALIALSLFITAVLW